jgi:hypothetical protein
MLGRDLHGHDDGSAVGHVVAHVVHQQQGRLLHPAPLPLTPLPQQCQGTSMGFCSLTTKEFDNFQLSHCSEQFQF